MPDLPHSDFDHVAEAANIENAQEVVTDLPKIGLRGDFIDRVTHISDSTVSLMTSIGYLEKNKMVLVPFADVTLRQDTQTEDDEALVFSEILTLGNLAGMLADLSTDLRSACQELGQIARGRIGLERSQLSELKQTLQHMSQQVQGCIGDLDGLPDIGSSEQSADPA